MSTTPLTDAINALTQYANETTGASDTTLSDAVGTLVAGYGGGGGLDPDSFELVFGSSGSFTTNRAYSNVLVQLGIGGSSSYQNVSYSVNPDKVIAMKHHDGYYWGTWLYYENLPAGTTFTIGNSGGYKFMTIMKLAD